MDPRREVQFLAVFDIADSLSANKLASLFCAQHAPKLILAHSRCDLRQVHLCTTKGLSLLGLLSPMYSVYTQTNFAKTHISLLVALNSLLQPSEIDIVYGRSPAPEDLEFGEWCLSHTLLRWCQPGLLAEGRLFHREGDESVWRQRLEGIATAIKAMFNGNWRSARPVHVCRSPDGPPCCSSPRDTSTKMIAAVAPLLQIVCNGGHLPRENAWFKLVQSLKPWALGAALHNILPRTFTRGLRVKLTPGEDLTEYSTDSFHEINAKRGKKAAASLQDPTFGDKMLLAVVATEPLDVIGHSLQTDPWRLRRRSFLGFKPWLVSRPSWRGAWAVLGRSGEFLAVVGGTGTF